jgi:hypothetical protein
MGGALVATALTGLLMSVSPAVSSAAVPSAPSAKRKVPIASASAAADHEYVAALDQLYDGSTDRATSALAELAARSPDDPIGPYLQALALCWKIEQRPQTSDLDKELHQVAERALLLADAALKQNPEDVRARLARGAAHGVKSRLHLFRLQKREAAREAVRMREDLLAARERDPEDKDVTFGIGLYDYYADVLPRFTKLLRFLAGIPGGNRQRGLAAIETAREGSRFHGTEVRVQLYEIHAFYEDQPDRALAEISGLRRRYPGSPLWALKLAEHQRDRLGLYAESGAVAREVIARAEEGHPNYSETAAAMARVAMGESLLLDLRLPEARRVLLPVRDGVPGAAWVGARARLLLGRSLELEGDREGALAHYRLAATSTDRELRRRGQQALQAEIPAAEVRASTLLAEGRRHREAGRWTESMDPFAAALRIWPECQEAALRVAEDELAHGLAKAARERLERLSRVPESQVRPPWVRPWSWLLRAQADDLAGEREAAVLQYKKVYEQPFGRAELRDLASAGLRHPFVARESAAGAR